MNENLLRNNFLLMLNFIEKDRANWLADSFRKFAIDQKLKEDSQVSGSQSHYNYIPFLKLLIEKIKQLNDTVGVNLLPTCTYSRVYKKGNILHPHLDRPSCEVSLTLNLSGTDPWPLYIRTPHGDRVQINLNPGDGIIYLGQKAEHWREEFQGEEYIQVFLHYVNASGPYAQYGYEFHDWINNNLLKY